MSIDNLLIVINTVIMKKINVTLILILTVNCTNAQDPLRVFDVFEVKPKDSNLDSEENKTYTVNILNKITGFTDIVKIGLKE